MKKKIFGVLCVAMMLILVGCGKEAEAKVTKCTLSKNDVINNYKLESTYEIHYKGDIVNSVKSAEKVTSDDSSIIDQFATTLTDTYSKMQEAYGGYEYDITRGTDNVVGDVSIDYEKLNLEKLAEDDPTMSNLLNDDNKILKEKLQSMYEGLGAECEEVE